MDVMPSYEEMINREDFLISRALKFPKHPGIIKGRLRRALRQGTYEKKEADAVLKTIKAGDRVLELGGGIGFMSTHIAKNRAIESIDVFEANPHLVPYIEDVHKANGITNARVHNAILAKRKGRAEFFVRGNILASSLDAREEAPPVSVETIEARNAGHVMAEVKPTILVCDIEGAEEYLIPLMDLSGLRAAILELHPQWIGPEGVNKVFSAFMAAGLAYHPRSSAQKVVVFRRNWPVR